MSNLRKTAVAVFALSSGVAFAGAMGPVCSSVNVTVPCESTAWDFGAKALYLQSSVSNTPGTVQETYTDLSGNAGSTGQNPQYGWGFMIEGSYHFNTGNDLNLNWYHINNANSRTVGASGPFNNSLSGLYNITQTKGVSTFSVDPHWDAVNLEVGQHVDFGENKSIRFHGGVEYARLTANTTNTGTTLVSGTIQGTALSVPTITTVSSYNPTYNGFGPRAGADMAYDWGNGLSLYANGAAGLLAGSSKYTTNTLSTDGVGGGAGGTITGSSTIIVPELEGKLGATYTYAMAQGDLTLDAGWMWINYFNAVRSTGSNGDFGLQGPFIGLKWLGNIA